jgi:hypothetical protein
MPFPIIRHGEERSDVAIQGAGCERPWMATPLRGSP